MGAPALVFLDFCTFGYNLKYIDYSTFDDLAPVIVSGFILTMFPSLRISYD